MRLHVSLALAAVVLGAAALTSGAIAQSSLDDAIRQLMEQGEAAPPPPQTEARSGAMMRGLDTFSGQVSVFTVQVGEVGRFERMAVRVLACHALPGEADAYAFVEITDTRFEDAPGFSGWMIASSPALSALEHPRYDVWLQSCSTEAPEAP